MKECKIPLRHKNYTISYYNEKWKVYDYNQLIQRIEVARPLIEKILTMINLEKSFKILDIGTGPGTLPIALVKKFNNTFPFYIYGIDPSSNSISRAKMITKQLKLEKILTFKLGSFEEIPFPQDFFDLITTNAAFNLSINKEKGIDEIKRVIKNNGIVILADCFKKDIKYQDLDENDELWVKCISGAVTVEWLKNITALRGLVLTDQENITETVKHLIISGKWNWREFIEYNLDYYIFKFKA